MLNRRALRAANAVFANKRVDMENLARIVPQDRLHYVKPGIAVDDFPRDTSKRDSLRSAWSNGESRNRPVIMTAAMMRKDVKTQSLTLLIEALAKVAATGRDFLLVLAGTGPTRRRLQRLARRQIPDRHIFLGKVDRADLPAYYGAADLFAFPGVREGLGMVYLEAQCCGLPVVAFDGWGVPEVVNDGKTGILTPAMDVDAYAQGLARMLDDPRGCERMGEAAMEHVRTHHDLNRNYVLVEDVLAGLAKA
jgi:glycosyltransferase involved in cell wall biosynthesis